MKFEHLAPTSAGTFRPSKRHEELKGLPSAIEFSEAVQREALGQATLYKSLLMVEKIMACPKPHSVLVVM